jgi:hypothetical protein
MRRKDPPDDYEVGYGKPPQSTKFQAGQSGNPKGRPRKPVDGGLRAVLTRIVNKKRIVTVGGTRQKMSYFELACEQVAMKAAAGNTDASKLFFQLVEKFEVHIEKENAKENAITVIRLKLTDDDGVLKMADGIRRKLSAHPPFDKASDLT